VLPQALERDIIISGSEAEVLATCHEQVSSIVALFLFLSGTDMLSKHSSRLTASVSVLCHLES
jgi:hypothetical protein